MIELLVIVLGIVGFILFQENRSRLKKAETALLSLKERLDRLEAMPPATQPAAAAADLVVPVTSEEAEPVAAEQPVVAERAATIAEPVETPAMPEPVLAAETIADAAPKKSLESRLGAQWTVWVGGLALAFGGLLAVKYSIDQGLLSPAVRVAMAGLFGLALWIGGEIVRRRTPADAMSAFKSAMIPGVLTAAGTLTLMGTMFVAHQVYDFIGPATTFVGLGAIALATLGLSLLHGQAMAGLGLLAAFATPAMVSSDNPQAWPLFGFLMIVWAATAAASRLRGWQIVMALANVGLCGWMILYLDATFDYEAAPLLVATLLMLAGISFFWPGAADPRVPVSFDKDGKALPADPALQLVAPPYVAIMATGAVGALLVALSLVTRGASPAAASPISFTTIVLALAGLAALRVNGLSALISAGFAALGGIGSLVTLALTQDVAELPDAAGWLAVEPNTVIAIAVLLALGLIAAGGFALARHRADYPEYGIAWAIAIGLVPVSLIGISFIELGTYSFDLPHGGAAILVGIALLGLAEWQGRKADNPADITLSALVGGSWLAFMAADVMLTNNLMTIILTAAIGFAFLLAGRLRHWAALPWAMVASGVLAGIQIGIDPAIVGPDHLWTTPVFNQLLAGYGIPAVLLVASAWMLRAHASDRLVNALQALASLFVLMTFAIEVRHFMQGGVLDSSEPTLAEQSIYTLLAIGASATMMALGLKRPSIVFKWGSMLVGGISMVMVLIAHLFALNPYFSGESTGTIPVFNLLLIGYLLPGLAYAGLAVFARNRRPLPYVMALALTGAILVFFWVTLTVRRFWHGEFIADWKGLLQEEMYTYSAVWLVLGVILLVTGIRFKALSLRIASAVLVLLTVLKVFIFDLSNLEGILRPLSFIGLGLVLIGIGMFYQRVLMGPKKPAAEPVAETGPETGPEAAA